MSCHWCVLCTKRTCNSSITIWTRICFCSAVKKWGTHRRCRTVKRSDYVRCRCTVHDGSRKTDPPRKLAHRRKRKQKRKFGKSREYCLIDTTAFQIWSFGSGDFLSAGKLSTASIFSHRRVCHSVLPKRAYKIVVDCIESHPFHPEIEDDWLLVHQATDPKSPSSMSFFPKKGKGDMEKDVNGLSSFDCSQPS
jgi:hypothetical protein